jgi:hypothetical protein
MRLVTTPGFTSAALPHGRKGPSVRSRMAAALEGPRLRGMPDLSNNPWRRPGWPGEFNRKTSRSVRCAPPDRAGQLPSLGAKRASRRFDPTAVDAAGNIGRAGGETHHGV